MFQCFSVSTVSGVSVFQVVHQPANYFSNRSRITADEGDKPLERNRLYPLTRDQLIQQVREERQPWDQKAEK
jgi:hypothetical protein